MEQLVAELVQSDEVLRYTDTNGQVREKETKNETLTTQMCTGNGIEPGFCIYCRCGFDLVDSLGDTDLTVSGDSEASGA